MSAFRSYNHPIRLNRDFNLELAWWREFFCSWNGLSFLLNPHWAPLTYMYFQVSSDAAGSIGYGAIFEREWFAGSWSSAQMPFSIAYKEHDGSSAPFVAAYHLAFLFIYCISSGEHFKPCCRGSILFRISENSLSGASSLGTCKPDTRPPLGGASGALTEKCQYYLTQGLAPATRRVNSSPQHQFIKSCRHNNEDSRDSILSGPEQMLIHFVLILLIVFITHPARLLSWYILLQQDGSPLTRQGLSLFLQSRGKPRHQIQTFSDLL